MRGRISSPIEHPFDRDKLSMVYRDEAASAAFTVLHPLQTLEPHVAVAAVGVLYWCLCRRLGVDPADLYALSGRIVQGTEFGNKPGNDRIQSLRDFVTMRLAGVETTIS